MDKSLIKKIEIMINRLVNMCPVINHQEIRNDIHGEVEISTGFFIILTIANLIALSGLMINSAPVIIGAMLISPLMGPMLSFGFAFITGDTFVWGKSLRKIIISVLLTIFIAALASYLSPLNEITREISARTTPNIFDLLIAFLSGTAGAAAICTKKNYLTIVPGVAIATAVIPPLSVTGFGIGNGYFTIAAGAFFLFFTNFVAIVLSTCLVFYLYGFRPRPTADEDMKKLKRRLVFLSIVLLVISVPLVYTLSQGVAEIKMKKDIEMSLKKQFNREKFSRLVTFSFAGRGRHLLEIDAVVNTVSYMKETELEQVEKKLENILKRKVRLHVDQVKVMPGGLIPQESKTKPLMMPTRPSEEIFQETRNSIFPLIRQISAKADDILSPSKIMDFSVAFQDKSPSVLIWLKIRRDSPLSVEESVWLENFFSTSLNMPIRLLTETVPFVPTLFFDARSVSLTEAMKNDLQPIKEACERNNRVLIILETVAEANIPYRERIRLADERAGVLADFLCAEYNISPSQIRKRLAEKAAGRPSVKITLSVLPEKE